MQVAIVGNGDSKLHPEDEIFIYELRDDNETYVERTDILLSFDSEVLSLSAINQT